MTLLTLPHELLERILLLATNSIQTCRLVNKALNEIIQSSLLLQYFQACEVAGVIDNPLSPLSYPERLEALKKREDAWRNLKPVFETTINVNHHPPSHYGLTEGAYFLGDHKRKDLHYCPLPSSPQDDPQWIGIPIHVNEEGLPGYVANIATDIYEHDLIIKTIISTEVVNQADEEQQSTLYLLLLKFSTGEYHPLACRHRIHVQTSSGPRIWVSPGIAGDNLVLVVHNGYYDDTHPGKLFIFDWKTGHKRLEHEAINNPYLDFAFISPELLLVPNLRLSHFEIWHIPPNFKLPVQILCLQIPAIKSCYMLENITCGEEPKLFHHSIPRLPPRPFFPSLESSIIIVNIHLSPQGSLRHASFALVMDRRSLLDTIQRWTSTSIELEQQEDIKNELSVHKVTDPDDEPIAIGSNSVSRSRQRPARGSISQVRWAAWGPPISRWFRLHGYQTGCQWPIACNSQRCTFWEPSITDRKLKIRIADFNPHNMRRHKEMMKRFRGEGKDNGGNGDIEDRKEEEEEDFEILQDKLVFPEGVYMGLKCVVYRMPNEYDFDEVLMDGERLLGLKHDWEDGDVERIQVLYFG